MNFILRYSKKFILFSMILSLILNYKNLSIASEKWSVNKYKSVTYAQVAGEVQHGDTLGFFIPVNSNCDKVWNIFSFLTFENNDNMEQILDKHLPIKLNGIELTAKVESLNRFSHGYQVIFSLGVFPIKEYIYFLNEFYAEQKKYEIEIIDGINFKAKKYFDIQVNNWKLENLVESVSKANKMCREIIANIKSS